MKLLDIHILQEEATMSLDQAREWLERARREDEGPGMGRSTRDELNRAREAFRRAEQQARRDSGEVKTVKFDIPEERATEVYNSLHKMWQNTYPRKTPWQMYHSDKPGKTMVGFIDYKPGDQADGAPVEALIDYVKGVAEGSK